MLFEDFMTDCRIMDRTTTSDGEGGYTSAWAEGAKIKAAIVLDNSSTVRIAEKSGFTSKFTITTLKNNALDFHDVIKRVSDGAVFRVTSNASDKATPATASFDVCQCSAERWSLT